jgi:transcriptional regulator with XRE-family HTH domain
MPYTRTIKSLATLRSRAGLEKAMRTRDLNAAEVGRMAGTNRQTVSNLRRGSRARLREETARQIEKVLAVAPGALFAYDSEVAEAEEDRVG